MARINGTNGDDDLAGTAGNDVIFALDGDDRVSNGVVPADIHVSFGVGQTFTSVMLTIMLSACAAPGVSGTTEPATPARLDLECRAQAEIPTDVMTGFCASLTERLAPLDAGQISIIARGDGPPEASADRAIYIEITLRRRDMLSASAYLSLHGRSPETIAGPVHAATMDAPIGNGTGVLLGRAIANEIIEHFSIAPDPSGHQEDE